MIALCKYILQGGNQCGQAAIKGEVYCRHHLFVRQAIADAAPQSGQHGNRYGERAPLPFVFPEDRAAVQINYFLLLQAINDGRVDAKTATLMLRVLKACDANLKKGPLNEAAETVAASGAKEKVESEEMALETGGDERISVEASAEPARMRHERVSATTPQKREPLDLLRHSRGMRKRRR